MSIIPGYFWNAYEYITSHFNWARELYISPVKFFSFGDAKFDIEKQPMGTYTEDWILGARRKMGFYNGPVKGETSLFKGHLLPFDQNLSSEPGVGNVIHSANCKCIDAECQLDSYLQNHPNMDLENPEFRNRLINHIKTCELPILCNLPNVNIETFLVDPFYRRQLLALFMPEASILTDKASLKPIIENKIDDILNYEKQTISEVLTKMIDVMIDSGKLWENGKITMRQDDVCPFTAYVRPDIHNLNYEFSERIKREVNAPNTYPYISRDPLYTPGAYAFVDKYFRVAASIYYNHYENQYETAVFRKVNNPRVHTYYPPDMFLQPILYADPDMLCEKTITYREFHATEADTDAIFNPYYVNRRSVHTRLFKRLYKLTISVGPRPDDTFTGFEAEMWNFRVHLGGGKYAPLSDFSRGEQENFIQRQFLINKVNRFIRHNRHYMDMVLNNPAIRAFCLLDLSNVHGSNFGFFMARNRQPAHIEARTVIELMASTGWSSWEMREYLGQLTFEFYRSYVLKDPTTPNRFIAVLDHDYLNYIGDTYKVFKEPTENCYTNKLTLDTKFINSLKLARKERLDSERVNPGVGPYSF